MNSWQRFAVKSLVASLFLPFAGCGSGDGSKEYAQACAAFEARDFAKAEKYLLKSLAACADRTDAYVLLARARLSLGELAGAQAALADAAARAGGDSDVRLLGAQLDYHAKNEAKAAAAFAAIAQDVSLAPRLRSQAMSGLGVVEMSRNDRDRARIAFLTAIRLDRRNPAAWYHLGCLYRDGYGYTQAALEQFGIYVRLEQKESRRAQEVVRTVIPELKAAVARAAEERPGAHRRNSGAAAEAIKKADEAWKKGQYKTAKNFYQQAYENDPQSYPAVLGLARAWEKTDASAAGRKKTFGLYREACVLRPSAVSTYLTTGKLALELRNPATAIEIYSRAMAADPSNVGAIDGLIRALQQASRKKAASVYQAYRDSLAAGRKR